MQCQQLEIQVHSALLSSQSTQNLCFGPQPKMFCMPSLLLTSAVAVAPCTTQENISVFRQPPFWCIREMKNSFIKTYALLHVSRLYFCHAMRASLSREGVRARSGSKGKESFTSDISFKRDCAECCSNCSQGSLREPRYSAAQCYMAETFLPHPGQSLYLGNSTVKINLQLTI